MSKTYLWGRGGRGGRVMLKNKSEIINKFSLMIK